MEHVELAEAAAVVGAVGAPAILLARSRLQALLGLALLTIAMLGLAAALVPSQLELILRSPLRLGAAVAGIAVVAALAAAVVRWPVVLLVALMAAAPIRVPVELGDESAFLLIPLYVVIAAGALGLVYILVRGGDWSTLPTLVALPLGLFAAFASLSLVWSRDPRAGAILVLFFLLPFAVLAALVGQASLTGEAVRAVAATLIGGAAVIAGIGLWQEWTRTLFFAPTLESANSYTSFFRITSIFKDSSIYGRFLVIAIVVLFVLLMLSRVRPALGLPVLGFLLLGLYFSYSQSSFAALFAAVLIVSLVAGDRYVSRRALVAAAAALVLVSATAVVAVAQDESARRITSGRVPLASLTLPVFLDHPVAGVGIGAQARVSSRLEEARARKKANVSHTTPLTVAAELGVIGLALYLAFLASTARGILLVGRQEDALSLSLLGAFTVLVVHSVFYSGFFEDPLVWGVAGLTAAALLATTARPAHHTWEPSGPPVPGASSP